MAIANVLANDGQRPQQIKTDGTTPVTVSLSGDVTYALKHLALADDLSTGAVGIIYYTTAVYGATPATVTAAPTGALGRAALIIQAANPNLASAIVGPGVTGISFLSSAGNPVVQIEPLGR